MSDLETRLRVILAEQDMTVRQLAGCVGISYSQLQRYATGKAKPNPENLKLLADRLGVPAGWLRGEGETFAWEVEE